MTEAESVTTIDDARIRVTTWTFRGVGAATGPHVHGHDYVVVPVTGGTFEVTGSDGMTTEMVQQAGAAYRGNAGTAHDVANAADRLAVFVEIELID